MRRKLIYFAPETRGGLADYARAQAEAISREGVEVIFLTRPSFDRSKAVSFRVIDGLKEERQNLSSFRWIRRYQQLQTLLQNLAILRGLILSLHVKEVLWSSFFEYGALFWADYFRGFHRHGVRMGVMLHDPVRDYQIGPSWWHLKSIKRASALFDCFFVHINRSKSETKEISSKKHSLPDCAPMEFRLINFKNTIELRATKFSSPLDLCTAPLLLKKIKHVPHGLYFFPSANRTREIIREEMKTKQEGRVWLLFGHLRDGKNLDRILEALKRFPEDTLWVIGKEQSTEQKSIQIYQEIAIHHGVAEQCRWIHTHLPESEVGNYFEACDGVLLTYSQNFHSSSGVLSHAVRYRRAVIASGGESTLTYEVQHYHLGVLIEADSTPAIEQALADWNPERLSPEWERYEADHSWEENAKIVLEGLTESK